MTVATRHGYRWLACLGLGVLILEVLVVGLVDELSTLIVFLSIDGAGALIGLWIVKMQSHEASRMRGDWRTSSGMRLEKEGVKNQNDAIKAFELLHQAGFIPSESERLCLLRRRYMAREGEVVSADMSRLKFVRWLVETGKLTDQL